MLGKLTFVILFCCGVFIQASDAAVSLSVNPIDGSASLRFERTRHPGVENKQEIHIRVSSSNGDRYQVFQRVLEPLMNEKGEALNLQVLQTQTLSNSNSYGTLYLQNSDHLSTGDQLLYSSGQSGQSDAFMIGYSLDPNSVNTSGRFRGRLVFTVRGLGNASSDQVTIDVFLETSSSLSVSVKGAHDPARISIRGSDSTDKTADYLGISFLGNDGQEVRVYQEVETMPQNETSQELGADVLQIDPQGSPEGLRIQGPNLLGSRRTLIYSSNKNEDNFLVYFLVNADQVQQQDAGSYAGKIKYIVQTGRGTQEFPINIQCAIPPVFNVKVTPPPGGVSFSHVLAGSPPQEKEVRITVLSNLHKPYQVIQSLQAGMSNAQGKEFDNKYFNIQVEIPSGQNGQTDFVEFSPVKTGEYPVFSSDARGSGAAFTVVYRLQGYAQMSAGDFSVPIKFSLNQK